MTCPRRPTTASASESGGGFNGEGPRAEVPSLPPGRPQALPQGRALSHGEVRGRAPELSAGRARPRADQAERVPAPAPREAEGTALLRPSREAVPEHVRKGDTRPRGPGREPASDARDAPRQRRLPAGLRGLARAGPPA